MLRRYVYLKTVMLVASLCICFSLIIKQNNYRRINMSRIGAHSRLGENFENNVRTLTTKHILVWKTPSKLRFLFVERLHVRFATQNCSNFICSLTIDENSLEDITLFDAIVFSGPKLTRMCQTDLPMKRSPRQIYVFATMESAHNYPICNPIFDGFFNFTWTYKLDSDSRWTYIIVRDLQSKVIAPNVDMHWIPHMRPIDIKMRSKLKSKRKAAAWFVSNCRSKSGRERFVNSVIKYLRHYNLTVDIYGTCGTISCPREFMKSCLEMLESDYFFYFAFENSFSEDYVTEKLLHALMYNTVPVVYGGANYTRFMPNGMYLDGRVLGAEKLAQIMNDIIHDRKKYYSFFKYKNHYNYYHKNNFQETNDYCEFCDRIHDNELINKKRIYENFRQWWNNNNTKC